MATTDENDEVLTPDVVDRFIKKFQSATKGGIERHSKESLNWFRSRVSKDINIPRAALIRNRGDYKARRGTENRTLIGRLYYFQYEAENAGDSDLGVYDEFPMVFIFNSTRTKDGHRVLWGLNLHYATPVQRAMLYTQLLKLKTTKGWTEKTKLRMTWNLIKSVASHKLYEKCVHAYRVDRIQTKLIEIEPTDWEVAVFLQLQKWKRPANGDAIQSDIRRKIRARK